MDFNDFLADLRIAGNEFSEKISDKYAATMAYCETACKGLDRLERDAGPYENQVIGLWVFLGYIQETYPKLTSGPAINALCQKIFRHCARTVLNIQWQQLDENSTSRQNFEVTLQGLNQCLSASGYTRFALILSLMDSGWTRPILSQVMGGEEDTEDEEGLKYIINEDPVVLKIRVEMMLQENCEEFALNLCSWCLKHPALKDDLDIRQTQLMLFHKLNNSDRLQEECQKIPCHDGVRLISRMRQMEKYKSLCTRLAQIFLVQDWIRQSEHCCTKDLLKLWIRHQYLADRDKEKFLNSVWAIAKLSCVTEQILMMIDALKLECGDMFLQLYTDLCIFAINFDKSCLEKHMQDGDMEGLRTRQQAMASTCEKLANVYLKNDTKITRYSAVTSFALNPSKETLLFVEKFYLITTTPYVIDRGKQTHEDEKCCTNCFRGEGTCQYKKAEGTQSDAHVDVATLLEVERLLNMLRPFYLNPDMPWTELKPLCERFLHERERLAQKYALESSDNPATDVVIKNEAESVEPVPSVSDHPVPSTAPPASVLVQTSSTPLIQLQKLQPSQTLVAKSDKSAVCVSQNIGQAISTKSVPENVSKTVLTQNVPQRVSNSLPVQNVVHLSKSVSSRPVSKSVYAQNVPQVSKSVTAQHVPQVSMSVTAQHVPQVSRSVTAQHVPQVSRSVTAQHVPQVSRSVTAQHVPQVSRSMSAHNVPQHISKSLSSRPVIQLSRPVSAQNVPQPDSRSVPAQQVFPQLANRPVSKQHVEIVTRPLSTHHVPHVPRSVYTQHITQQPSTSGSYTSPVSAPSQQTFIQPDTSSLVGIEPSVMLSEEKNLMIRNLLFSNEEISLADFPDADALVELLQQALPGGGTELPETLQDISIDNTGIGPALHVVQDTPIPEQMKRTVQSESNFVSLYSTPTRAQAVPTSLCNTSHLSGTGANINADSLAHSLNLVQGLSVPVSGMSMQSAPSSAQDMAALVNMQTVLEMPHAGIQSSGHSLKQAGNKPLSYVAVVTQAGMVTSTASSQNMSASRSNVPIQPRITQSRMLRPGVAGVAQQGTGAGQQHVQAVITKNVPNVSSQTLGTIRMAAMGSQLEHNMVDTSVQSLQLSSLPGKPVVTPKSYPNVSSSSVHSDTTVAQNTEQIQQQQQSVSSFTQNSLKNLLHQQSMASLKAANAQLHAQQIVSGSSQKSGQTISFDAKHVGSVQRTMKTVDQKQGENVSLSHELMQNILTGGAVQVIPTSSSMMIGAPAVANMLQSPTVVASQSPRLLYTTAVPTSLSVHQSLPNITEYNQAVSSMEINQQALHSTGDLSAMSSVIALLNLQSQTVSQSNAQSSSQPKVTKTLKTVFNKFQKHKPKKRSHSHNVKSYVNEKLHVKSLENLSKEAPSSNRLNFGTSIDMPQEPIHSMHLHGISTSYAPPPSASVLEQTVTKEQSQSFVSAYGQTTSHQQNATAALTKTTSAALIKHLQSTRPALVQQGQQIQHIVGAPPQQLQQSSLAVLPSTGQTQNNIVHQAQTIFIPAVGQQNTAAVFQPTTVGQLTFVHQVPNQTLFTQPGILQSGIQVSNISQMAVSTEPSTQQIIKHSENPQMFTPVNDKLQTGGNYPYASQQRNCDEVLQPTTTSMSKAHVPFMLASRLCSSSSKKYTSTCQSKYSQSNSKPKPQSYVKDFPVASKAGDLPPFSVSARSSEVSNQLERFLLNSVLPKQPSDMTSAVTVTNPHQNVQGQFHSVVQSTDSLHTQSSVPLHTIKHNTHLDRSIQPLSHNHLGQKSVTLGLMDCSSSRSSYVTSDGAQVPVGFTHQQAAVSSTNGTAIDNLNNALHLLATKTVKESVQEKYSDQVVDSFFSDNEASQASDLLTMDEPYLIESVSSRDLLTSQVYETLNDVSKTLPHPVSALSAEDSKPDVQKKRIVSKRLFTTKFRCMICSEVFEQMEDLRDHVRNPCTPGKETSDEKLNRINACEAALKQRPPYPKLISSDKPPTVTKKSLEASRVYECPVCKVLCKTDEEVLHHRFDCLKSKSKPRQRKPKVPSTDKTTTGHLVTQTSPVVSAVSADSLQDACFNSSSLSLTTLSPLSSNSCGIVSPLPTALVSPISLTSSLVSPMSSAVISPMSTPPPQIAPTSSAASALPIKTVKSVSHKASKVRRVPHTGLLGTRPKPPPKPMTPERIADLLLVWRTVEWVRAALGVAAPSVRIKALDLARSNSAPSKDPPDSKLVEALDIDKSVVAKIKVYEENQKKLKNKKKKKSTPKADSSLDSIASMKSIAKSVKKQKAPPRKKPSNPVIPSTNVKETSVMETNAKETNVKETNVKETNVKETNVKETNVKETNVKETNIKETKKIETTSDAKPSNPVKRKRPKKKPEPKFQVLEHLGRKYYKCGLCGQTFCNLDFMVTEHWEKCLSQNPKQRKTKPGGPGDKNVQKVKTNKETNSGEDKLIPTSAASAENNSPASTEENKDKMPVPEPVNKDTPNTESKSGNVVEEGFQKKFSAQQKNPLPSVTLSVKSDAPHIDFAALLKETFSNALGRRTLDVVQSFDDQSFMTTELQTTRDTVPDQVDRMKQNIPSSIIPMDDLQKSDKMLEPNLNLCVPSSQYEGFAESNPNMLNINQIQDLSRLYTESGLESEVHDKQTIASLYSTRKSSVAVSKLQGNLGLNLGGDDGSQKAGVETSSVQCQDNLLSSVKSEANSESSEMISQSSVDKYSDIKPMDVTLMCDELLKQMPVVDNWMEEGNNSVDDNTHFSDVYSSKQLDSGQVFSSKENESDLIHGNKSCEKVEEKTTNVELNFEEYFDGVSQATDTDGNKPASEENTDDKVIEKPFSATSVETTYDDKITSSENTCDDQIISSENTFYDKMIEKPCSPAENTSDDKNSSNDHINKPCGTPTSVENNEIIEKLILTENVSEKCSELTDKPNKINTVYSLTPLGKKRPILDRDAKNMNSGCTLKVNQTCDWNSGRDVSCNACGALFRHVRTLIQHMVSRHLHPKQWTSSSISSIPCPFCSFNCCSYMSYMNHLPKHTTVILEKMGQHLLLDEKKSHSRIKTRNKGAELLKNKQKKEVNSDLASEDTNDSQHDSLNAVDSDTDEKTVRKRGRPKKQIITSVKDDHDTKIQKTEKYLIKGNSVHSNFKSMCLPLEDIATIKPNILRDNSVKLSPANDIEVLNTKPRLRQLRSLRLVVDDIAMADVEGTCTRSRKSSLSDYSTESSKQANREKTEQNVPTEEVIGCKTRSRKSDTSGKRGTRGVPSPGKRQSTQQTRSNQMRKNLIKAAQAHVVTQRKKAVFASSDKKQELKKETNKEKCEKLKNKQIEQPSKKSYSLRNSAHLYIKSRQNIIGLHTSPVVRISKCRDVEEHSNVAEKRVKRSSGRSELKSDASCKDVRVEDRNVKQEKRNPKRNSSSPIHKKKIRIQFLKRYDETSLCFNKKANSWQAFDRVFKTWKFLSDKHFVHDGHNKRKLSDEHNPIDHSVKCVDRQISEKPNADLSCESEDKLTNRSVKDDPDLSHDSEDKLTNLSVKAEAGISCEREDKLTDLSVKPDADLCDHENKLTDVSVKGDAEIACEHEDKLTDVSVKADAESSCEHEDKLTDVSVKADAEISCEHEDKLTDVSVKSDAEISREHEDKLTDVSVKADAEISCEREDKLTDVSVKDDADISHEHEDKFTVSVKADAEISCEHENKVNDVSVKADEKLIELLEDRCATEVKDEPDKADGLKSPSFQDSSMSYLYQETKQDNDEPEKQEKLDSPPETPPKKELKGVKSLRSVVKSKSFEWEVEEGSGVKSGAGETVNHSGVLDSSNNPADNVPEKCVNNDETTKLELQEHNGIQTKDGAALLEGIVKEPECTDQTVNEDLKLLHPNDNSQQATTSISQTAVSDQSGSGIHISKSVQDDEIPQQTGVIVSDLEITSDQSVRNVSSTEQEKDDGGDSDVKSGIRQPKSLKAIAARIQTSEANMKSEIPLAVGIKSPVLSCTKAEPVEVEVQSKSESADVPLRAVEKKSTDVAVMQQSDTEEEEDEKKKQRIERSLKSLREKTNVAPFTWDVDDDDRPTCRKSLSRSEAELRNEPTSNVYTRAVSVGTSSDMLLNARYRRYGNEMKTHVFRKVTRSCSSDSLNLYNKLTPLTRIAISHGSSPASRVASTTDLKPTGGLDVCKPSKVVLEKSKSFVSVGTGQSCRTRSCERRSFQLETFLKRNPNLDSSAADNVNNTTCRKRRLRKSGDSPERKHFGMTMSSKESIRTTQRGNIAGGNSQIKYGSSKGQQALSNAEPLPAVVRRNSHRLTTPINSKASNVQFYRVAPTVESKQVNMRSTRNAVPLLEEKTRHTLMIGDHVQSGPQLRTPEVKKIDQKWIIDKRKHKKASFPYAFTRKHNQWK